ncbi:MAG: amidohydrolase family protein [Promethearchaeota archaeon]
MKITKKYEGPKYDAHIHLTTVEKIQEMLRYIEEFNIQKAVGIVWEHRKEEIEEHFPDQFTLARFLPLRELASRDYDFVLNWIDQTYEQEYVMLKFWLGPRWRDYAEREFKLKNLNITLDDPDLDPIFERMEDYNFIFLVHVSDPDLFYDKRYQPVSRYGRKEEHLKELENVLVKHPKLRVQGAHFASQPEHLDNLSRWLDRFPNLSIDTASARWMTREFGRQRKRAKEFFERYQDRILFGSDVMSGRNDLDPIPNYYIDRYHTFQALFETSIEGQPLPFPDDENNNETKIFGLDLPVKILKKIYWENSRKLYG